MRSPVNDPRVSSPYGMRVLNGKEQFHDGIDFVSRSGDRRVFAVAPGVVVFDMDDYEEALRWTDRRHSGGNMIIIAHNIGRARGARVYYARYLHLGENTVGKDWSVDEGQVVGEYADAGISYGPHLHFDLYDSDWRKIDPTPLLREVLPS